MKRRLALCAGAAALLLAPSASAVNKNQSAEYVRTLNRNASTDVDATFYNPAGLAFLPGDGLFVSVSNQFIFIDKSVQDKSALVSALHPAEYEGTTRALVYPDVHLSYHFLRDFAAYLNFVPIGGGGGGEYGDGIPMFDAMLVTAINGRLKPFNAEITSFRRDLYFEGSSYNLSWSAGAAYKISDVVGVALGYRLIYASRGYTGHVRGIEVDTSNPGITGAANAQIKTSVGDNEFEVKSHGFGHTFIGGVHVRPVKELNIGLRTEVSTHFELENETTIDGPSEDIKTLFNGTSYGDGKKTIITDPWLVGLGVSYLFFEKLKVEADVTVGFNRLLDLGGDEKKRRNNPFAGAAVEYAFLPSLKASVGYAYDIGYLQPEGASEIDAGSPVHYVSGGLTYGIVPTLDVTGGLIYGVHPGYEASISASPGGGTERFKERSFDIGIGLSWRLPKD